MKKLLISVICGVILGILCSRYLLVGSGISLIPWAIIGVVIGYWGVNKKEALTNGALYGFALSFVFMLAGYNGSSSLISRIPFFALLGIFGGICGSILSLLGNLLRKLKK